MNKTIENKGNESQKLYINAFIKDAERMRKEIKIDDKLLQQINRVVESRSNIFSVYG